MSNKLSPARAFQFTHPGRGATAIISSSVSATASFNSRTPGGVRLAVILMRLRSLEFQFTHPGRGATQAPSLDDADLRVSIHAPREGCDLQYTGMNYKEYKFQFTHPGRGATGQRRQGDQATLCFNSRTPGGVRLSDGVRIFKRPIGFNSRTPGGVRPSGMQVVFSRCVFQFTHPGRGATMWCKVAYYRAHKQA